MARPPRKIDDPVALLTINDIARLDRVSTRTVRRAIAAGLLPVIRFGRLVRIEPAAHEAYRRQHGG